MSGFKLEPGPGKIAVEQVPASEEVLIAGTSTRLWVPSSGNNEGLIGRVVFICKPWFDGTQDCVSNYDVGDLVVVGKYSGTKLDVGRQVYVVLDQSSVLAKIVQPEPEQETPDES